jgi:hypothetical protein
METTLNDLDLLRRIASTKLPFRLLTPEDFNGAKALMASGYVKVALPLTRNGKGAYGKQVDALVSAITPAGRRALAS